MPPYEMFTKDFVKEIYQGKKKLLKLADIRLISVVKYDELSVKALYDKLLKLKGMPLYFPAKYPKGRKCDRDYMFNVANTLYPEVIKQLNKHALNQRYATDSLKM